MKLTRKQLALLAGGLLALLALVLINLLVSFGGRAPGPAASGEKLKIVSAKMHPAAGGKRFLEFHTDRAIHGDTSFMLIFGTRTGYTIEGTGLLTTSDKVAGPVFHINVLDLPRFDQPELKKKIEEHVRAGNLYWVEVRIYNRGEFLHDPEVFQDSRLVAQGRIEEP